MIAKTIVKILAKTLPATTNAGADPSPPRLRHLRAGRSTGEWLPEGKNRLKNWQGTHPPAPPTRVA
jgi:hypothetical protein